ncbi:MAG: hypothetical protein BWY68_00365 [bacterium ADurb.Bin400]|nr:MAG: hypothetical protein BWY68_00365 [bacterium ADurb.Bin400]
MKGIVKKAYALPKVKDLFNFDPTSDLSLNNLHSSVERAITWILNFAGIFAFIMLMYASFLYVTSYGDEAKAETAKKTIIWTVAGIAVIVMARIIMTIVKGEVER